MKKYVITFFLLFTIIIIQAQEAIVSSGGEALGADGAFSFSVGQIVYSANINNDGYESQGVQHAIMVYDLSSPSLNTISLNAFTYPNPTKDNILLNTGNSEFTGLSYILYDINGRIMKNASLNKQTTQISLVNLDSGIYLLKLNHNNIKVKTFKIIKSN